MNKYIDILNGLREIYKENKFSLGLHTTSSQNAKSIVKNGLEERYGRTLEGTVKLFGDAKNDVELGDLDWFFPYTDATVMVAIPSIFKVGRGLDADGGNKHTCDFSIFVTLAKYGSFGDKVKEIFSRNGRLTIPPELIIGYYNKQGNLSINEKCALFYKNHPFIKQLEEIYKDEKNKGFIDFYKTMNKDSINFGDNKSKTNE